MHQQESIYSTWGSSLREPKSCSTLRIAWRDEKLLPKVPTFTSYQLDSLCVENCQVRGTVTPFRTWNPGSWNLLPEAAKLDFGRLCRLLIDFLLSRVSLLSMLNTYRCSSFSFYVRFAQMYPDVTHVLTQKLRGWYAICSHSSKLSSLEVMIGDSGCWGDVGGKYSFEAVTVGNRGCGGSQAWCQIRGINKRYIEGEADL